MTRVKVSLAKIYYHGLKEFRINPFWFTTDHSIKLSYKAETSATVELEKLSERSLLELSAANKLCLIEIETEKEFIKYLNSFSKSNRLRVMSAA